MRKTPKNNADIFVHLMMTHQTRIYGYVLGLVGNYSDADDVMQETTTIMWQKFETFELGSDFVAWAIRIARFKVLELRKRRGREAKHLYSEDLFQQLVPRIVEHVQNADGLLDQLRICVGKLNEQDHRLVQLRFYETLAPKHVAQKLGVKVHTVYKRLSRIQSRLLDCVEQSQFVAEGRS